MTTFTANISFDSNSFNLRDLFSRATSHGFEDNIRERFFGRVYQDIFTIDYAYGDDTYQAAFGGYDLAVQGDSVPYEGRITVYAELETDVVTGDDALLYTMRDFNLSAWRLFHVAETPSAADDKALLRLLTAGNDLFQLSNEDDLANGYRGQDRIYGRGGNDDLRGGSGLDWIYGGDGDDILRGNSGNDLLRGHKGNDNLFGGADSDSLWGNAGDDKLLGGKGVDRLWGNGGADLLKGQAGDDALRGQGGNDTLKGGGGDDLINGGGGQDSLFGGAGADVFEFSKAIHSNQWNPDWIMDFHLGEDEIDLSSLGLSSAGLIEIEQIDHAAGLYGVHTSITVNTDGSGDPEMLILLPGLVDLSVNDLSL
ncbi:MAG: calcium-binding protein [Sulfitobacter sp.]